jgi:hypothetical protein
VADQAKPDAALPRDSKNVFRPLLRALGSTVVVFLVAEIAFGLRHGGFNSRNFIEVLRFYYWVGILVLVGLLVWEYRVETTRPFRARPAAETKEMPDGGRQ